MHSGLSDIELLITSWSWYGGCLAARAIRCFIVPSDRCLFMVHFQLFLIGKPSMVHCLAGN